MIIIPAIDIRRGRVVRLTHGAAELETVYSDSPLSVAKEWDAAGAELLHVVDLDGALEGELKNLEAVREIARSIKARVELGGGIRDTETIAKVLDAGVAKVVLGTRALDEKFLAGVVKKFGSRIVVGIDAKHGVVHTKGWVFKTETTAVDLAREMERLGVSTINYTDIMRDGTLEGPNLKSLKEMLASTSIGIVASGGVSSIEDIKKLKVLKPDGLVGVIVGKALYEKTLDLREAIRITKTQG